MHYHVTSCNLTDYHVTCILLCIINSHIIMWHIPWYFIMWLVTVWSVVCYIMFCVKFTLYKCHLNCRCHLQEPTENSSVTSDHAINSVNSTTSDPLSDQLTPDNDDTPTSNNGPKKTTTKKKKDKQTHCEHTFNKDHFQYFGLGHIVVSFKFVG